MTHDPSESNEGLGKQRIETLADGIFAIAMTLLVLDVKVPRIPEESIGPGFLFHTLVALWPKLLSFVLSFVILGMFWIAHHGYSHFLKRTDRYYLWINLLFLIAVVFVPFSADLLGMYPRHKTAEAVYGLNIMCLGWTLYGLWSYATTKHRLVGRHLEAELIRKGKLRILTGILANFCAMALAFVNPRISLVLYVLFPVIYFRPSQIDRHWTHSHG